MAKRQKMVTNIKTISDEIDDILEAIENEVTEFHQICTKYDSGQIPYSAYQAGEQIKLPRAKKMLPRLASAIKKLDKEVKTLDKHMQKWNADKKLKNLFRKGELKASKKQALQLVTDERKHIANMKDWVRYWNEMLTVIYNVK